METLSSIFTNNSNILLPDGSMVKRGEMNIIGIFNSQGGSSREKLPNSLLYNSIYHIVENPNDEDIKDIIEVLFKKNNLSEDEIKSFTDYFFKARKFSSNTINEIPLSLTDIRKYIDLRIKCPLIDRFIINQFIFVYRFVQKKSIEEIKHKLGFTRFKFEPKIYYESNNKKLIINLSQNKNSKNMEISTYNNMPIEDSKIINKFDVLTVNGKYCLLFLICSVLSKRTCLLQGETCSGKSFLIRFLAEMLGQKLIIYQMNSNIFNLVMDL